MCNLKWPNFKTKLTQKSPYHMASLPLLIHPLVLLNHPPRRSSSHPILLLLNQSTPQTQGGDVEGFAMD